MSPSSKTLPGLDRVPGKQNWIEHLPAPLRAAWKRSWIYRAAKHLHYERGRPIGVAIASAINAAEKGCATGDLNFPGVQQVNAKSRAEMCAAVATWKAMRAAARTNDLAVSPVLDAIELTRRIEGTVIDLSVPLDDVDDDAGAGDRPSLLGRIGRHLRGDDLLGV